VVTTGSGLRALPVPWLRFSERRSPLRRTTVAGIVAKDGQIN
jgi:hypothetical protein